MSKTFSSPPGAKLRTCLFFDDEAERAAEFYVSLLPGSRIETVSRPRPDRPALVVEFSLAGAPFMALNGGMRFESGPAMSISVLTRDQAETDALWAALTADGGAPGQCGWLSDRFGVHWQIVPEALPRLMSAGDPAGAGRVQQAIRGMGKIDIAALEAAFGQA